MGTRARMDHHACEHQGPHAGDHVTQADQPQRGRVGTPFGRSHALSEAEDGRCRHDDPAPDRGGRGSVVGVGADGALVVGVGPLLTGQGGDRVHDVVGELATGAAGGQAGIRDGWIGVPKATVTSASRRPRAPTGWTLSVPMSPTGTTGTPAVSERNATPVRPR